jgi:hypothetical protein
VDVIFIGVVIMHCRYPDDGGCDTLCRDDLFNGLHGGHGDCPHI